MADLDDIKDGKDFGLDRPADTSRFFLKGAANHDWGMKERLCAHLQSGQRPHGHAGLRPRLFPGPDHRP